LPDDYLNRVYPYRSVLDAGVNLAFSSDAPVVKDFSPLMGLQNAVERRDQSGTEIAAEEKISIDEALKAYTQGAASAGDDKMLGTLSPGNWADFVLLEQNPLTCSTETLSKIEVTETWIAGKPTQNHTE
jgi:predicted amidohydrolase YtcJ